MSSSLFRSNPQNNVNIKNLLFSILSNNPEKLYNQMYNSNPQFKDFVDKNKGKSLQEIARDYGIR